MTDQPHRPVHFISVRCQLLAGLLVTFAQFTDLRADGLHSASPFVFRYIAEETEILPATTGIQAHVAGWRDVNRDGWTELYLGTFHYANTKPNTLLHNREGRFVLDEQPQLRISTRVTGLLCGNLGDLRINDINLTQPTRLNLAMWRQTS